MADQERPDIQPAYNGIPFGDTLIRWIKKKKLETPATLFLEMHRPLMPLAHPAAVMLGAFVAPLFGPDYYEKIEALRDPKVLDKLLARLADRNPEGDSEPRREESSK